MQITHIFNELDILERHGPAVIVFRQILLKIRRGWQQEGQKVDGRNYDNIYHIRNFSILLFLPLAHNPEFNGTEKQAFDKQEDHDSPISITWVVKVNNEDKYRSSRPNDYEKEKTHNFNRGLGYIFFL